MAEYWKIILIAFYLQPQTLKADNMNTELDKMLSYTMKLNVRPCDDFFSHACGNYKEKIFYYGSDWNRGLLDYANDRYFTAITKLLNKYGETGQQMEPSCGVLTEKVKNYFESCRRLTKRTLTEYLHELKPGLNLDWPILENESSEMSNWPYDEDFDVYSLMGKLSSLGIPNGFLKFNKIGTLDKITIEIRPHYNSRSLPTTSTIRAMLSRMRVGNVAQIVEDTLETDQILRRLLEEKENLGQLYFKMKFSDLINRYPNLNFTSYFGESMENGLPLNASITLYNPPFFQELNDKMWLLYDKAKLCTYLMIKYLKPFYKLPVKLTYTDCKMELRAMFNLAINFLYYHQNSNYIETQLKPDVAKIFQDVVDMLRVQLQSNAFKLTIHEIAAITERLSSVRLNIGNLPDNASCESIAQLYSSVPPLDENKYYKNHLIMMRFIKPRLHDIHFEATYDFRQNLPAVTYSASQHMILLNYDYLRPPVYHFNYNNLGKYSLLGFILAQQLIVANEIAEDVQSVFFQCGELKQEVLGGLYTEKDRSIDSLSSEVIRKIVILKYFNHQPMELLDYWNKHFFLYMAQYFCNSDNTIYAIDDVPKVRLNRIVMNIEGFAQTFSCPKDSQMNPSRKCKIF